MIGSLDLSRILAPNIIAIAGWVIVDTAAPLRWQLTVGSETTDISTAVYSFARPDLMQHHELLAAGGQQGFGFLAIAYAELESIGDCVLSIAAPDGQQVQLALAHAPEISLEQFFFSAWQPVRLKLLNSISRLPDSSEYAALHAEVRKLASIWADEIHVFEHHFSPKTTAGIEHCAFTTDGQVYIEGWALTPRNMPRPTISACIIGLQGGQVEVFQSAFLRPDLANAPQSPESAPGFAIIAHGAMPSRESPTMIVEAKVGDELGYSKLYLQPRGSLEFTQLFWNRVLDTQTARDAVVSKVVDTINKRHVPKGDLTAASSAAGAAQEIEILVHGLECASPIRNLLRLCLADVNIVPTRISAVVPGTEQFDPVWMVGGSWQEVKLVDCLKSYAAAITASHGYTLLLDACSLLEPAVEADLKTAISSLDSDPELLAVVLAPTDMTLKTDVLAFNQRWKGRPGKKQRGAPRELTLCLNRGNAIPPVLIRSSVLKETAGRIWSSPLSAVDVRRVISSLPAQALGIMEAPSATVFFNAARPHSISREQNASIHKLFWWR